MKISTLITVTLASALMPATALAQVNAKNTIELHGADEKPVYVGNENSGFEICNRSPADTALNVIIGRDEKTVQVSWKDCADFNSKRIFLRSGVSGEQATAEISRLND